MTRARALTELHTAVFLFGFTAILGKIILLERVPLVWYRMGLTALSIMVLPVFLRELKKWPVRDLLRISGIGVIVALHWVTFFGSIKVSTVSVALSCFGTTAFFTAILEPLLLGSRLKLRELGIGAMVIPGIALIHHFTGVYLDGIILGLISALLACIFSILNKREVQDRPALAITGLEMSSGFLFLSILLPFYYPRSLTDALQLQGWDALYLAVLVLLCTTLAYVLAMRSLRVLSAFTANLSINLEPIYGIILAIFLLREHQILHPGFYLGAFIIFAAVFVHTWFESRDARKLLNSEEARS